MSSARRANSASTTSATRSRLAAGTVLVVGLTAGWLVRDSRASNTAAEAAPIPHPTAAPSEEPCAEWRKRICDATGAKSPSCGQANSAMALLPHGACKAALDDLPATLARIAADRAPCRELAHKLCTALGKNTKACKVVEDKTPSLPVESCQRMLTTDYEKTLRGLRRVGAPPGEAAATHIPTLR